MRVPWPRSGRLMIASPIDGMPHGKTNVLVRPSRHRVGDEDHAETRKSASIHLSGQKLDTQPVVFLIRQLPAGRKNNK